MQFPVITYGMALYINDSYVYRQNTNIEKIYVCERASLENFLAFLHSKTAISANNVGRKMTNFLTNVGSILNTWNSWSKFDQQELDKKSDQQLVYKTLIKYWAKWLPNIIGQIFFTNYWTRFDETVGHFYTLLVHMLVNLSLNC